MINFLIDLEPNGIPFSAYYFLSKCSFKMVNNFVKTIKGEYIFIQKEIETSALSHRAHRIKMNVSEKK